ncbi:MAG: MarR family winged helix-turn-helix transcriptional regulator [Spirochaetia bacterium]
MGALTHDQRTTQVPWEKHGGTVGHLVKLAYIAMRREMDASVRKAGVTTTQWQALGVLYHMPGLTHTELVEHMAVEPPSLTSLVNGMERKGWIKRERSEMDARVKRLYLTLKGRHRIESLRKATEPVERRMAAALTDAERESLKCLLRTLVESLK